MTPASIWSVSYVVAVDVDGERVRCLAHVHHGELDRLIGGDRDRRRVDRELGQHDLDRGRAGRRLRPPRRARAPPPSPHDADDAARATLAMLNNAHLRIGSLHRARPPPRWLDRRYRVVPVSAPAPCGDRGPTVPPLGGTDGPLVTRAGRRHDGRMFARYFVELPIEPDAGRARPDGCPDDVAPRPGRRGEPSRGHAPRRGRVRRARPRGAHGRDRARRRRSTRRARPCCRSDGRPPDAPGLFPALEADLEVAPLDAGPDAARDERPVRARRSVRSARCIDRADPVPRR